MNDERLLKSALCLALALAGSATISQASDNNGNKDHARVQISTGAYITPLAAPGSIETIVSKS